MELYRITLSIGESVVQRSDNHALYREDGEFVSWAQALFKKAHLKDLNVHIQTIEFTPRKGD